MADVGEVNVPCVTLPGDCDNRCTLFPATICMCACDAHGRPWYNGDCGNRTSLPVNLHIAMSASVECVTLGRIDGVYSLFAQCITSTDMCMCVCLC